MRNLCASQTTAERFSRAAAKQSKTSYYLAQTTNGSAEPSSTSEEAINEIMLIKDNKSHTCTTALNCFDMCCSFKQPDQTKIYMIQERKNN